MPDRRAWGAMIWPLGVADAFGAVRISQRLHWTQRAACAEAEAWVREMGAGPIEWRVLDEQVVMATLDHGTGHHLVVVRSVLLPKGEPR
jgi:hypothetical protein